MKEADVFAAALKVLIEEHEALGKKLADKEYILATVITNLRQALKQNSLAYVAEVLYYYDEVTEKRRTIYNTVRDANETT